MLSPTIRYPFINQLTGPKGFWSHAGHVSFCKRIPSEMRSVAGCGPSDLNGAAPVVVTPAVPGPGVRIPSQCPRCGATSGASCNECGCHFWESSAPVDKAPAVPGPGVRNPKKSNFDLTGEKLVKRGALVSWHGLRFTVSKVRMGTCYPVQPSAAGPYRYCNSVQVVV